METKGIFWKDETIKSWDDISCISPTQSIILLNLISTGKICVLYLVRNRLINTFILIDKFRFNVADFLNWCSMMTIKKSVKTILLVLPK